MWFIIRAKFPTEAGNQMVKDPNFLRDLENYMNKVKTEASYFFGADGKRTFGLVVDIQSNDQIPMFAEPHSSGVQKLSFIL